MLEQMPRAERSLSDLFAELGQELSTLMRREMDLAKAELSTKASRAGKNAVLLAAGGALVHAGGLAIIAGIILVLGALIPLWLSASIIGCLIAGGGYALVYKNLTELKRIDPAPRQTIETLKEDAVWLKNQAR